MTILTIYRNFPWKLLERRIISNPSDTRGSCVPLMPPICARGCLHSSRALKMAKMMFALFRHRSFDAILIASPAVRHCASVRQSRGWLWSAIIVSQFQVLCVWSVLTPLGPAASLIRPRTINVLCYRYLSCTRPLHTLRFRKRLLRIGCPSYARLSISFKYTSYVLVICQIGSGRVTCMSIVYWTGCRHVFNHARGSFYLWNTDYQCIMWSALWRTQSHRSCQVRKIKIDFFLFYLVLRSVIKWFLSAMDKAFIINTIWVFMIFRFRVLLLHTFRHEGWSSSVFTAIVYAEPNGRTYCTNQWVCNTSPQINNGYSGLDSGRGMG